MNSMSLPIRSTRELLATLRESDGCSFVHCRLPEHATASVCANPLRRQQNHFIDNEGTHIVWFLCKGVFQSGNSRYHALASLIDHVRTTYDIQLQYVVPGAADRFPCSHLHFALSQQTTRV
jgi:hypothetical protein